jgi:hypothetical protein
MTTPEQKPTLQEQAKKLREQAEAMQRTAAESDRRIERALAVLRELART